jgi:hypothetical protein
VQDPKSYTVVPAPSAGSRLSRWTIDGSPPAYRRAIDPGVPIDTLLRPLGDWRQSPGPHLRWLC